MGIQHQPSSPSIASAQKGMGGTILSALLATALALSIPFATPPRALADDRAAASAGSQEAIEGGGLKLGSTDGQDATESLGIVDDEALEASSEEALDEGLALSESFESEPSLPEIRISIC